MENRALSSNLPLHTEEYRYSQKKQCHDTRQSLESDYESVRKESINVCPPHKKKRRMASFISENEFNHRLNREEATEWDNLPEGSIYKLEECDTIDGKVVGRMIDEYNNKISVYLPRFLLDRLLRGDETTNVRVFVRRGKASEEVDIVTVENLTCGRDFSTRKRLDRSPYWTLQVTVFTVSINTLYHTQYVQTIYSSRHDVSKWGILIGSFEY